MSQRKIDPLQLIIYSNEQNLMYFNIAFLFFNALLSDEESGATAFIERLQAFTEEDLSALTHEIKLLDKKTLELNEHKTIILICVLYYVSCSFLDDKEEAILTRLAGESPEEMLDIRNRFLHFATYVVSFAKPHFSKRERFSHIIRWFEENGI